MHIYVSQSFPHETATLNKGKRFFMLHRSRHGKSFEKGEYYRSILKVPAGELADDKWVTCDLSIVQESYKVGMCFPQMRYPDRCIDKDIL